MFTFPHNSPQIHGDTKRGCPYLILFPLVAKCNTAYRIRGLDRLGDCLALVRVRGIGGSFNHIDEFISCYVLL